MFSGLLHRQSLEPLKKIHSEHSFASTQASFVFPPAQQKGLNLRQHTHASTHTHTHTQLVLHARLTGGQKMNLLHNVEQKVGDNFKCLRS